jgi:hypothetical protein
VRARCCVRPRRARRAGREIDRLKSWTLEVQSRTNHNKAACALANKLARIACAVWMKREKYQFCGYSGNRRVVTRDQSIAVCEEKHRPSWQQWSDPHGAKPDNSSDRGVIAPNVWLSMSRFHVGTGANHAHSRCRIYDCNRFPRCRFNYGVSLP